MRATIFEADNNTKTTNDGWQKNRVLFDDQWSSRNVAFVDRFSRFGASEAN